MRISVIMPVYLGGYQFDVHHSASNPEDKFIRAVDSFLNQTLKDSELIIVADGCDKAKDIWEQYYRHAGRIIFKWIHKQVLFSGKVRQAGIDMAIGEIVCYLDHDDMLGSNHLQIISDNFDTDKFDWVYYDDYLIRNASHSIIDTRNVLPKRNSMGTSSICHKSSIPVVWGDGNTHDFDMIEKYLLHLRYTKIKTPEYYVCHCSGLKMDF
jgi:glycosyltransferase involved in cell wall biosynthesis